MITMHCDKKLWIKGLEKNKKDNHEYLVLFCNKCKTWLKFDMSLGNHNARKEILSLVD
jgi:hypothetical protein